MDELERAVRATLVDHSQGIRNVPLGPFDEPVGARQHQRRWGQNIALIGTVVVVVGLVIAAGVLGNRPSHRVPGPAGAGLLHPSKAFAKLPLGAPPRIAYVYGDHALRTGQDSVETLPSALEEVQALTPSPGGGWMVASHTGADGRSSGMSGEGYAAVTRLTHSLHAVWTRFGAGAFAVAQLRSAMPQGGGSMAYFTIPDRTEAPGRLRLLAYDGKEERSWQIPFQQVAVPAGLTSTGAVVFTRTTAVGDPLGAWLTGSGEQWKSMTRLPLLSVSGVHGALIAGGRRNGCQVVLKEDHELWHRCDGFKLAMFSPDGRYLAAWHTETGEEFESVFILNAHTGRTVTSSAVHAPKGFRGLPGGSMAWEDAHDLLFTSTAGHDQEILRMDTEGRLERTTGAINVNPNSGFVLATEAGRPR